MTARPARLLAAAVTVLLATATAVAAPADAKPAKKTRIAIGAGRAVAGQKITLTARVTPRPPGGSVRFSSGRTVLRGCGAVTVHQGHARCTTTFARAGHPVVVVRFSGKKPYRASSGRRTVAVTAKPRAAPVPTSSVKGTFVGSTGACTTSKGALVAVNYARWNGPIVRGCDTTPTTGIDLLTTAKFTTEGTQHDGPQFLCRIGNPLFDNGTRYPTPATEACVRTPPASAYWSYWLAPKGKNTWTYASFGAYSQKTVDGDVQAWTFGATDIDGTTGQPTFTPDQVRAGMSSAATSHRRTIRAATARAGVASASDYLVDGTIAGSNPPAKQLVDGHYYDTYGIGFADYGLTIDAVFALAAAGTDDDAVRAIMEFLDGQGEDASQRSINAYTAIGTDYAGGGSIGKVALAAETTGYDPHDFAGHDLIEALDGLVCNKAIENECAAAGNYRNSPSTFAQALPIIAQLRAGDAAGAARPIAYLESLQHASGAFPSVLPGKDSETDSTGMAAMALALVPGATARTALAKALSWLAAQQASDGGFPGAAGDSTNSAAIAIQALNLDAQTYAAQVRKAQTFLAAAQNSDGGFDVAANTDGSDLRASTQVLGGVIGTPFGSVLDDLGAKRAAGAGASYLVGELVDGDHYETTFGGTAYPDQGLTADGVFALLAAGGHTGSVTAMTDYLKGQVAAYADPAETQGGPYTGAAAKLALVAEATDADPRSFGGTDLTALLSDNVCTVAIRGDSTPCVAIGDFHNNYSTVSQALGVLALQGSTDASRHVSATSPAVIRLHELQCRDGGFSSTLLTAGQTCTSDVDTTGYAVQALAAVEGTDTWLGAAQKYLENAQKKSGLFPGASGDNGNSTSLAAGALQSLVAALTSPTADPPQPRTIAPVAAWQDALLALRTLATGGGFALTAGTPADLRATTQAVVAAAHDSLLHQSGATILSLPRAADVAPPGVPPRTSKPTGSPVRSSTAAGAGPAGDSVSPVAGAGGNGSTADTGVPTFALLLWSLVLLVVGAAVTVSARRRGTGPHRGAHR